VQKIVERPVYQQHCFDADGVSAINSLVAGNTSEPPWAMRWSAAARIRAGQSCDALVCWYRGQI